MMTAESIPSATSTVTCGPSNGCDLLQMTHQEIVTFPVADAGTPKTIAIHTQPYAKFADRQRATSAENDHVTKAVVKFALTIDSEVDLVFRLRRIPTVKFHFPSEGKYSMANHNNNNNIILSESIRSGKS
jgi:hypothetical protein